MHILYTHIHTNQNDMHISTYFTIQLPRNKYAKLPCTNFRCLTHAQNL